jgi:hypothetical protein
MAIISNIRNKGQVLNLSKVRVDIEDTSYLSAYFVLSEFDPKFTAGKNTFLINGSVNLLLNSPLQIEVLDSKNNSLYIEVAKSNNISYTEGGALRIAVYIYDDVPFGVGKIIIVGRSKNGKMVRWVGHIQINPSEINTSKVVFYKSPALEVKSAVVPLGDVEALGTSKTISGSMVTTAIIPVKTSDYGLFNSSLKSLDYRMIITEAGVFTSASMKDIPVELHITQLNDDSNIVPINITASNVISEIVNTNTVKLQNPIYYINKENKKIVANVTNGSFKSTITDVVYDSSYKVSTGATYKQSIALVNYTNLKTFCGNVYRHKLYRRSLRSASDFEILADEPISPQEILKDENTPNSFFKNMGIFPNGTHAKHYWLTSSIAVSINRDASILMDAMSISNPSTTECYIIAKNDTATPRTYQYVPCDESSILIQTGSSYDSNFMSIFKDVPYKFSLRANVTIGNDLTTTGSLGFYITSSMIDKISGDINFDSNRGLKIGELVVNSLTPALYYNEPKQFYNKFNNNFYGTLVIYATNCNAILSDISLSTYSEPSFSPEIFVSRIPFPISVPGEQFEFKSELFDINSNLVYSNLRTISTFDVNGESFTKPIPGIVSGDTTNGLTLFNVIITSSLASQGLHILGNCMFEYDVSGSGGMVNSETSANFKISKGLISLSPKKGADGSGGKIYIAPDNGLSIHPSSVIGSMDNVNIGFATPGTGKFTTLRATSSIQIDTEISAGTIASGSKVTVTSTPFDVYFPLSRPDGFFVIKDSSGNNRNVPYYN